MQNTNNYKAKYFKNSFKEGQLSELSFEEIAKSKGFYVEESTREQNFQHVDYFISRNDKTFSVDVKGQKRVSRKDKNKSNDLIWVELKNVTGRNGWLYGKQDLIAFQDDNGFIVVNRESLAEKIDELITDKDNYVTNSKDALYRLYQRKGRKDCITLIKREDLLKTNHRVWDFG